MGAYSRGRKPWERINTLCSYLKTGFKADIKTKICFIFWKEKEKSQQRWELRPQTLVGLRWLGTPPPDPHVVTHVICSNYFKITNLLSHTKVMVLVGLLSRTCSPGSNL